jgi:hypothetical protein
LWLQAASVGLGGASAYHYQRNGRTFDAVVAGLFIGPDLRPLTSALQTARLSVNNAATIGKALNNPTAIDDVAEALWDTGDPALEALALQVDELTPQEFLDRASITLAHRLLHSGARPAEVLQALGESGLSTARLDGRQDHALHGNVVPFKSGFRGSGGHYLRSRHVRITSERIMGRHGVIQANISIYDSKTNKWWPKRKYPAHTFFPDHWSERKTRQEIEHAFNNAEFDSKKGRWTGRSSEGVKIAGRFTVDPSGYLRWTSAYPVIDL